MSMTRPFIRAQYSRPMTRSMIPGPVTPTGPILTTPLAVSGTLEIGETLTAVNGTWTGSGAISYADAVWYLDGVPTGDTGATYVAEEGAVSFSIAATDDNGTTTRYSPSVAVTQPAPTFSVQPT